MLLTVRHRSLHLRLLPALVLMLAVWPLHLAGQEQPDSKQFSAMQWRLIGPFRAGRVTAVAGIPGDPNTYYFGTPGGGVWKTTNGGQVWHPIFDGQRVASIGALAVAPSDPGVIYVGTGEQTRGRGLYRSPDSGTTWQNVGLQDLPYIQAIIVDPQNPDVVVVGGNSVGFGILWRPLPKSAAVDNRGIFRTEDGGKTWKKVFAAPETLGVVDMCSDPADPRTLYAVLYRPASGAGDAKIAATSDIVKSSDGGSTWAPTGESRPARKGSRKTGDSGRAGDEWPPFVRNSGAGVFPFGRWRRHLATVHQRSAGAGQQLLQPRLRRYP